MKPSATIGLAILLLTCINTSVQAQQHNSQPSFAKTSVQASEAKNPPVQPTVKTQISFNSKFPEASNMNWTRLDQNNFYVSFLDGTRKANACFSKTGDMNYSIIEFSLAHLPVSFQEAIGQNYAGYTLLKGTQITAHGNTAYQAVLENSSGFKTLKFADGVVELISELKK